MVQLDRHYAEEVRQSANPPRRGCNYRWWAGTEQAASGWRHSPWFGAFRPYENGWLYHADLGWLYVSGDSPQSAWLWSMRLGWLWTGKNVYPYLYRHEEHDWYLFMKNIPGRTLLFRYANRQWIDWNAEE